MIFKQTPEEIIPSKDYADAAELFAFSDIKKLMYPETEKDFLNLQNKIDDRIYPDLIASIYRKMYENGMTRRPCLSNALLACSYHLQNKRFQFLGFMRKDEEIMKKETDIDYVTAWDFAKKEYAVKGTDPSTGLSLENIDDIFNRNDFKNCHPVFFIAGCQSFEMLDLRIKKAANLISQLIQHNFIEIKDVEVILSGWNNAKIPSSKVQFANESLAMRNLLIHKLKFENDAALTDDFINKQIDSDINSKDTNENIEELLKKMEFQYKKALFDNKKQLNLFIISSTFHLIQLADHIRSREQNLYDKMNEQMLKLNLYLVGSENPDHFFKIFDGHYIKLLTNEVIHRGFKFCRKT